MQCLQRNQLLFFTQQEESEGKIGNEQILQEMQKTHTSQRDEIILFCVLRDSYSGSTGLSKSSGVGSIPTSRAIV